MTLSFCIVLIGSIFFVGDIDMRFTTIYNQIPYYVLSITGIILILCISQKLETINNISALYYIGNHTMPILALNLLALKFGNLIKIWIYGMPLERLSSYTVIYENNTSFWLIYTAIGVVIPMILYISYQRFIVR